MAARFLQRSRHKSDFRRKVPPDLRSLVGASVLYKSLRTTVRGDAVVPTRALAARTDRVSAEMRRMCD